jgi:LemA protein
MSNAQIAVLVGAAVLVFWMVGAYNRLVALRSAIGSAWLLVDEVLKKRGDAVRVLVAALREPLAGEQGALDALLAAERQLRSAADALGARPLVPRLASALTGVEPALASATSRVLALLEQHPELHSRPDIDAPVALLRDSAARLAFTRQLFNEAALAYDRAVQQFPTNLLARIYRFAPAGRL